MTARRGRTQAEWIKSLQWNIQDAREALGHAISMSNWTGARKYIGQLEKLEQQLYDAEDEARTVHHYGSSRGRR